MKTRKYLIALVSLLVLALCALKPTQTIVADKKPIHVGILQHVEHGSYNETRRGITEGLLDLGYKEGETIEITHLNAGGDMSTLQSMAEKLSRDCDYLFAIGTPSAQALSNVCKDKPVYFSAVTDPVGAGIVASIEEPGGNVTGTSNLGPIEEQIALMQSVYPEAKTIGLLYNAGESNSQYQIDIAKEKLKERGLNIETQTVASTNDISSALNQLLPKVDCLFLVTDNTCATSMGLIGQLTSQDKKGIFGGSNDMILENGLATYGLDYYSLGKQTANMMQQTAKDGVEPAKIPVQYAEKLELVVNEKYAKEIGMDPASIKAPN